MAAILAGQHAAAGVTVAHSRLAVPPDPVDPAAMRLDDKLLQFERPVQTKDRRQAAFSHLLPRGGPGSNPGCVLSMRTFGLLQVK